jgi:hypothetical protein
MEFTMKTKALLGIVLVVVLLMAGSVSAAPSNPEVPFRTVLTVQPTFAGPLIIGGQVVGAKLSVNGYGDVMHLGASTWHADMWVNTTSVPSTLGATFTFTADNGDTLTGSYLGTGQLEGSFNHCRADFWITGGTGRFANITGEGEAEGWHPVDQSPGPLEFDGLLVKNK